MSKMWLCIVAMADDIWMVVEYYDEEDDDVEGLNGNGKVHVQRTSMNWMWSGRGLVAHQTAW